MRRSLGVLVLLGTLVPFHSVGLPTLAIPFSHGMTAYASGIGHGGDVPQRRHADDVAGTRPSRILRGWPGRARTLSRIR
ncbi:MAG TPA: hypothetical protein VFM54_02965 [Micromonosporaceae bacterium]|nr:hypothetical protein [Micromonosporaceae bacterium]